jgi:phenylacetate-coenzyme A ligase PaaK-like adenylate-forming protein
VAEVSEPTLEWQMVRPTDDVSPLVVRVERGTSTNADDAELAAQCAAAVHEALGIDAQIQMLARDTLPRAGYKAARVVDE